jgi:hypothetical protein
MARHSTAHGGQATLLGNNESVFITVQVSQNGYQQTEMKLPASVYVRLVPKGPEAVHNGEAVPIRPQRAAQPHDNKGQMHQWAMGS